MAARGVRSRQVTAASMDSSPAESEPGSSARGRSVDTNASVSPVLGAGSTSGRGKKGHTRESSATVLVGSAAKSKEGAHSLMTAVTSPGGADDFQNTSRGRAREPARRNLLGSIDEEGEGSSSKSAHKRRAVDGTRQTSQKGSVPHKPAPVAHLNASVTDDMTQDVHGTAASPQMEFKVL